ncbi:MAG: hypothetical protein WAV38_11945 [Xanthobacteraceae bacterium]|jgi:hypothetical protein
MKIERFAGHNEAREDFCGERDGHYADRVFDFANSVLTARSNSKRRMARTAASGSSLVQFF